MDTCLIILLLVLVGGTVTKASSDFIRFECNKLKQCSAETNALNLCKPGEQVFVTEVNSTKRRSNLSSLELKEELQVKCSQPNTKTVKCFETQLSTNKEIHKYENVDVLYKCVSDAKTMKKNVHIYNEDKLTYMRLDVQLYDSSWREVIETGTFVDFNEPEEINCSSSLPEELTCTGFKMDVGADIGLVWVKISGEKNNQTITPEIKKENGEGKQCKKLKTELVQGDDKETILIVVGVVAAVSIFSNIGFCLVFFCRIRKKSAATRCQGTIDAGIYDNTNLDIHLYSSVNAGQESHNTDGLLNSGGVSETNVPNAGTYTNIPTYVVVQ